MRRITKWFGTRRNNLALLGDYFPALGAQWQDLLWGPGTLAVLWGIWFIVGSPPPWVNWLAVVLGLFLAGYYVWRADHIRLKAQIKALGTHQVHTPVVRGVYKVEAEHRVFSQIVLKCSTETPVYECVGHLRKTQRLTAQNRWQDVELDTNLTLQWANEARRSIEQYPGAEKCLNVFYVDDRNRTVVPCVNPDADIPDVKLRRLFDLSTAATFRFHVQIDCSDRVNGKLVSVAPEQCILEATFKHDPLTPILTLM